MERNPAGRNTLGWAASVAPAFRILLAGFSAWAGLLPQQLPFRRRAILPGRAFFAAGDSNGFSCCIKKTGTAVSCDVSYVPSLRQYLFFTVVSGSLLKASGYCKFL